MTESPRVPVAQDKTTNSVIEQDLDHNEMPISTPTSSPLGVYDSSSATQSGSSNQLWLILLIVFIIVMAFLVLRQWM